LMKMRYWKKAHKRGVQRDEGEMIGRGVRSQRWRPRLLHMMCVAGSPGSLRAIPRTPRKSLRCLHAPRVPSAGDLVPNLRCVGVSLRSRAFPPRDVRTHRSARRKGPVDRPGRDAMERMCTHYVEPSDR
jgi:hypothetical protein